jgi:uncharacterized membrane protein YdjX (TVP38/TMEM64 family)
VLVERKMPLGQTVAQVAVAVVLMWVAQGFLVKDLRVVQDWVQAALSVAVVAVAHQQ